MGGYGDEDRNKGGDIGRGETGKGNNDDDDRMRGKVGPDIPSGWDPTVDPATGKAKGAKTYGASHPDYAEKYDRYEKIGKVLGTLLGIPVPVPGASIVGSYLGKKVGQYAARETLVDRVAKEAGVSKEEVEDYLSGEGLIPLANTSTGGKVVAGPEDQAGENTNWLKPIPGPNQTTQGGLLNYQPDSNEGGLLNYESTESEGFKAPQSWIDYTNEQTPQNAENALLDFFMAIYDNPELHPMQIMNNLMDSVNTAKGEYEDYRKGIDETMNMTGPTLSLGGEPIKTASGENVQIKPLNTMRTGLLGYQAKADMSNRKLASQGTVSETLMNPLLNTWNTLYSGRNRIDIANVNKEDPPSFWERWLPVAVEGASSVNWGKLWDKI